MSESEIRHRVYTLAYKSDATALVHHAANSMASGANVTDVACSLIEAMEEEIKRLQGLATEALQRHGPPSIILNVTKEQADEITKGIDK